MAALTEEELAGWGDLDTPEPDPNAPVQLGQQNLGAASMYDPDKYAKDSELSKKTGVPIQAIDANREKVEAAAEPVNTEDWMSLGPGTKKYLESPASAIISQDDLRTLAQLEKESNRSWYDVSSDTFAGFGDSMMIGMGKTYDQAWLGILNEQRDQATGAESFNLIKAGNPMMWASEALMSAAQRHALGEEGTKEYVAQLDKQIEKHRQNLEFAESEIARLTPQDLTITEEGLRGGLQMIADMAPGLAISIGTRGKINPTIGYLTGKTWLDSYGSAILGGKDHNTAKAYAGIDAALEFATERLPTKRLEAMLGEVGGTGLKSSIKRWLIGEAGTEQIATLTQSINAYAFELDEELAAAQGFWETMEVQSRRQAVTFISTLAGGGSMAASIKGVDYLANRERRAMGKIMEKTNKIRGSGIEQDRLDDLIYLAQSSKTNTRAGDEFENFMNTAAPDETVYMAAEAVELLTDPPAYLTDQLDGSGGNVSIPLSTFLKDFANDEASLDLIRPHIKTNEGLSTQAELEEDTDSAYIKSLLDKANESAETKNAADEIYERITEQLVATGRQSRATARQSATLIPAQVTTQFEYLKSIGYKKEDGTEVTLEELFEDFGLAIVGPKADIRGEFMQQEDAYVYHATFSSAVAGIETEGLAPFRTSNWRRADQAEGERYNEEGGVFSFTNPDDAIRWAQKMEFEFGEPVSVAKIRRDEQWQTDPADDMFNFISMGQAPGERGEALRSMAATRPSDYAGAIAKADFGYPGTRGITQEEWRAEMVAALDAIKPASPRVLKQQDFGNIAITETVLDMAGMPLDITESANDMWQEQQRRQTNLEALRRCFNG